MPEEQGYEPYIPEAERVALPIVTPPAEVEMEVEEEVEKLESGDDREDLGDLTKLNDKDNNHLFGTSGVVDTGEEDDVSDLVDVSNEDIMGEPRKPKPKYRLAPRRRKARSYPPSFGGMQY